MLLSFLGCHGIQCLKLCNINEKKKVWQNICNSVALFVYIATHFSPRNRLIYRRKTKEDKNFMMWMLELFVDVDKLVLIHLKKLCCYLNMPEPRLSKTTKIFCLNWKSQSNVSQRKVYQWPRPNYGEQPIVFTCFCWRNMAA